MTTTSASLRARWATVALGVWACGVLLFESLALVGLFASLLLWAWSVREQRPDLRAAARRWWPVWAFVAWAILSGLVTGGARPTGVARTLDWLALPLAAWTFAQLDARGVRTVATAAFALVVASSVAAGLQNFGAWPSPETFEPLRWTKIPFGRVYEPAPVEGRFMGGGFSFHRLKYSHVGGLTALFALVVAIRATGRTRALAAAVAAIAVGAITFFTYARSATAAVIAATALTLLLHARNWRAAVGGVVGVVVAVAIVFSAHGGLRARFAAALTPSGSGDRHEILASGVRAFRSSPISGVGVGGFTPARYADERTPLHVKQNPGKAHNQLFSIAIETGVIGAALFCVLLGALLHRFIRARIRIGIGVIAYFILLGLAHDPLFQAEFSLAIVLALGICCALAEHGDGSTLGR